MQISELSDALGKHVSIMVDVLANGLDDNVLVRSVTSDFTASEIVKKYNLRLAGNNVKMVQERTDMFLDCLFYLCGLAKGFTL